jgi:hypothetical protein
MQGVSYKSGDACPERHPSTLMYLHAQGIIDCPAEFLARPTSSRSEPTAPPAPPAQSEEGAHKKGEPDKDFVVTPEIQKLIDVDIEDFGALRSAVAAVEGLSGKGTQEELAARREAFLTEHGLI